jgi:hypothetical protein
LEFKYFTDGIRVHNKENECGCEQKPLNRKHSTFCIVYWPWAFAQVCVSPSANSTLLAPAIYVGTAAALVLIALAACVIPRIARRASRVDPAVALRNE